MTYDPFARGAHPVGVSSTELVDPARERRIELELWYPADARYRGHDLAPNSQDLYPVFGAHYVRQEAVRDAVAAARACPLVLFSHGMAGHRRQSTFLCTHLASHGYLVIAPDHGGSTLADMFSLALRIGPEHVPADIEALLFGYVADRPRDVDFLVQQALAGGFAMPCAIEPAGVALTGHSFGGFTALAAASSLPAVRAVVALAPAGGAGPLSLPALRDALTLDFAGRVATLYLALERDSLLPLSGIAELYARTPKPARMFVLENADHMHFCDRAESSHEFLRNLPRLGLLGELAAKLPPFAELAASEHGYDFARALCLAQLDASLRNDQAAAALLASDVRALFSRRGIAVASA